MKTLTFRISDKAFELLCQIHDSYSAEYRDTQYESLDDFTNSEECKNGFMSTDSFLKRNFNGTYYLIPELLLFGLVDMDDMCWHTTYVITDFGKHLLSTED
jgi:hypothetical protein